MTAPWCKDCVAEEVTTKRKLARYKNGNQVPGPRCSTHHRAKKASSKDAAWERYLVATYGITAAEYWAIYERQEGRCYICRRGTGTRKRLAVDHDHKTGVIRGLLDQPCNRNVLGHLRDDVPALQRAIDYLTTPPALEVIGCRAVPDHSTATPKRVLGESL